MNMMSTNRIKSSRGKKCTWFLKVDQPPDGTGGTWTVCPKALTRCPLGASCVTKNADIDTNGRANILDLIKVRSSA